MTTQSAGFSDAGRRANNEDAYCVEPSLGLFAVADGVGGYEGGEIASRLAVEALRELFARNAADPEATWPYRIDPRLSLLENLLSAAARLANRSVRARKRGRLASMGSTLAALAVGEGKAAVAHLGDSRVYRLRGGRLQALTRDHSLWADMVAAGGAEYRTRSECPYGNVITRALGLSEDAVPELRTVAAEPGDVFLLCSDGVSEPLAEEVMARLLGDGAPALASRRLVERAIAEGGRDNATAVVVRVGP